MKKLLGMTPNTKGVLHELLVLRHLKDDAVTDEHAQELDKHQSRIYKKDFTAANQRAKIAAKDIVKLIEDENQTIENVFWASKSGDITRITDIETSQKEDASDIVIKTESKYFGISLKVSSNTKLLPTSNPGIWAFFGAEKMLYEYKKELMNNYPSLKSAINKKARKAIMNSWSEDERNSHSENRTSALHSIMEYTFSQMKELDGSILADHVRNTILAAHKTPMELLGHTHIRHTTLDRKTGIECFHENPYSYYDPYLRNDDKIGLELDVDLCGTYIRFISNKKPLATQRAKFGSSEPLSSIKGSGAPLF
jgi:hypothetical protein